MLKKKCLYCNKIFFVEYKIFQKYCSYSCGAKDRVVSKKTKRKHYLNAKRLGLKPPSFLGKHHTKETKEKLRKTSSGKRHLPESILKMKERKGCLSGRWKDGISSNRNYKRIKKMEYLGRKWNAEGSHTKIQWEELKKRYNYMCLCCKRCEPEIKLTEDHIVPISKGGSDKIENIQPLCNSCNSRKHTKTINYVSEYFDNAVSGLRKY